MRKALTLAIVGIVAGAICCLAVQEPKCDPSDARGIGCVIQVTGQANLARGSIAPSIVQAFDRAANRRSGIHLRSGDSFWLAPGASAKVVFYYPRSGASMDPVTLKGPEAEQSRIWFRDAVDREYTDAEMMRLRRRLRLAAAPKAAAEKEIVLPASGDLVSSQGFVVVVRTGGDGVRSSVLSVERPDGWSPLKSYEGKVEWPILDGLSRPVGLDLSTSETAKLGRDGSVKLVLGLADGVMQRTFRIKPGPMDERFVTTVGIILRSRSTDVASFESLADTLQEAIARTSVSAVAGDILLLAKANGGLMKARLVTQQPNLAQIIEDLFIEAGFKEDEVWPLLAHP